MFNSEERSKVGSSGNHWQLDKDSFKIVYFALKYWTQKKYEYEKNSSFKFNATIQFLLDLFDRIPISQKDSIEYETGHEPPAENIEKVTDWFEKNLQ